MNASDYSHTVLGAFAHWRRMHPDRCTRYDRLVARRLYDQATPLELVLAAILLAETRLANREAPSPLPAPRSLAYILPVVEELRDAEPGYVAHLLQRFGRDASAAVQISTVLGDR